MIRPPCLLLPCSPDLLLYSSQPRTRTGEWRIAKATTDSIGAIDATHTATDLKRSGADYFGGEVIRDSPNKRIS